MFDTLTAQLKPLLERQLRAHGGGLPPAPDGPVLPRFDALQLAQAIEHELARSEESGFSKISISMTIHDAAEFAKQLRYLALVRR